MPMLGRMDSRRQRQKEQGNRGGVRSVNVKGKGKARSQRLPGLSLDDVQLADAPRTPMPGSRKRNDPPPVDSGYRHGGGDGNAGARPRHGKESGRGNGRAGLGPRHRNGGRGGDGAGSATPGLAGPGPGATRGNGGKIGGGAEGSGPASGPGDGRGGSGDGGGGPGGPGDGGGGPGGPGDGGGGPGDPGNGGGDQVERRAEQFWWLFLLLDTFYFVILWGVWTFMEHIFFGTSYLGNTWQYLIDFDQNNPVHIFGHLAIVTLALAMLYFIYAWAQILWHFCFDHTTWWRVFATPISNLFADPYHVRICSIMLFFFIIALWFRDSTLEIWIIIDEFFGIDDLLRVTVKVIHACFALEGVLDIFALFSRLCQVPNYPREMIILLVTQSAMIDPRSNGIPVVFGVSEFFIYSLLGMQIASPLFPGGSDVEGYIRDGVVTWLIIWVLSYLEPMFFDTTYFRRSFGIGVTYRLGDDAPSSPYLPLMLPFAPFFIYPVLQLFNYLVLQAIQSIVESLLIFVWSLFLPGVDERAGSERVNSLSGTRTIDWKLLYQILGYNLFFSFFAYAFLSPHSTVVLITTRLTLLLLANLYAFTQQQSPLPVSEFSELPDLLASLADLVLLKPSFESDINWEGIQHWAMHVIFIVLLLALSLEPEVLEPYPEHFNMSLFRGLFYQASPYTWTLTLCLLITCAVFTWISERTLVGIIYESEIEVYRVWWQKVLRKREIDGDPLYHHLTLPCILGPYTPSAETAHPSYLRLPTFFGALIISQLLCPGFVALNTVLMIWVVLKTKALHNTIEHKYFDLVWTSTAARAVGRKYPRDLTAEQEWARREGEFVRAHRDTVVAIG